MSLMGGENYFLIICQVGGVKTLLGLHARVGHIMFIKLLVKTRKLFSFAESTNHMNFSNK